MINQYLYSKELRIKTNWVIVSFLFIWLLFDICGLTFTGYGLIFYSDRVGDLWPIWIFFFVMGFIALNIVLWNLRGREVISISEKGITLERKGKLFASVNKIMFFELDGIDFDKDELTPVWTKFWGLGGGKIVFRYLGMEKRIGQNLGSDNAEKIANEIKAAIATLT